MRAHPSPAGTAASNSASNSCCATTSNGRAKLRRDGGSRKAVGRHAAPRDRARQQQIAREEVHLDLAPLPAAIVDDPVHADRRRLGRPSRIDGRAGPMSVIVTSSAWPISCATRKACSKRCARVLVQDELVGSDKGAPAAVQHGGAGGRRFEIDPASFGFCDSELIGRPGVCSGCDDTSVKPRSDLPGELHAVHQSSSASKEARFSADTPASVSAFSKVT